ncbi:HPr family phosphocarrier protein [Salibacterium qingdaonense]|uniref:Phosphotransferase system HPr (HPr) family n=1 Tax=Salibacterium qingdaonense TaxID=266892 RepID=A0A1I4K3F0_9BACI|nr:HPr family phosphocarrier protein [Salibacterium qingdaonense]SFL73294.1 phosphotransferase system HPr (HPr) family [Salibacterium qingdaonense]
MSNKLESTATIQLEEKTYFDNLKMVARRANRYESYIVLESESKTVNGKSILGLSSFLRPSENVTLRAIGHDSRQAVQDIKHLFTHV